MYAKAKFASCLLVLGATFWAAHRSQGPSSNELFLAADATPQLDYLAPPDSFSRVENTKNSLEALSRRTRLETQAKLIRLKRFRPGATLEQKLRLDAILQDLRRSRREFAGTEQELEIDQDLLVVLKMDGCFKEWLEVYLQALYERPMHPLIAHFAADATSIGKAAGQEQEVLTALKHAVTIPLDFVGKQKITALLAQAASTIVATEQNTARHSADRGS